ncbi:hypothetical protein AK812_SmicGene37902 [Symbiodinium microadriaticum]|uniref:Uncharacterized protein n=1 Tax=Symbiodinium microadriaticum TaxID=2951 RepID=A0A1Q9CF64_SYMMI|nr:hypothetical protein AK812_SmicGene37902 [Symbiodinium microadriaticum]
MLPLSATHVPSAALQPSLLISHSGLASIVSGSGHYTAPGAEQRGSPPCMFLELLVAPQAPAHLNQLMSAAYARPSAQASAAASACRAPKSRPAPGTRPTISEHSGIRGAPHWQRATTGSAKILDWYLERGWHLALPLEVLSYFELWRTEEGMDNHCSAEAV